MRAICGMLFSFALLALVGCDGGSTVVGVEVNPENEVRILVLEEEKIFFLMGQTVPNSVTFCAPRGVQARFEPAMSTWVVHVDGHSLRIDDSIVGCRPEEDAWRAEMNVGAIAAVSARGYFILGLDSTRDIWTVPFDIQARWP